MTAWQDRFWSHVDKSGECWEWQLRKSVDGYGRFKLGRDSTPAHRVAYQLSVGPIPSGTELDHQCHNRACVNPAHLRAVTRKQNAENRRGANRNSTTGILGVAYIKRDHRWRGSVGHNGIRHAKYFDNPEDAAAWSQAKRLELFTHTTERKAL